MRLLLAVVLLGAVAAVDRSKWLKINSEKKPYIKENVGLP